jgi:hypothetical protein
MGRLATTYDESTILTRIQPHENGCWIWVKKLDKSGYGKISIKGKTLSSHRVSWEIFNKKKVPSGMCVLHKCDNPNCVNPKHLFIGTVHQNVEDMMVKGRQAKGDDIHGSKLTPKQIIRIKRMIRKNYALIAEKYGVTTETVSNIAKQKTWGHVY